MSVRNRFMIGALFLFSAFAYPLAAQSARLPSDLDLNAHAVDFKAFPRDVIVLVFVASDCPISNRYLPEIQRIHREFASRSVKVWIVYPNPAESAAGVSAHLAQYEVGLPALLDPDQLLAAAAQAQVTPEAAVFSVLERGERREVYRGRIDNRYIRFGHERSAATQHELEDAIEAVLAGRPVPASGGPPVGCAIVPAALAKP